MYTIVHSKPWSILESNDSDHSLHLFDSRMLKTTSYLRLLSLITVCVLGIAGLSGCNNSERDEDLETLTAREVSLAYHIFDDAFREVHRFAMRDPLINDTGIDLEFESCIKRATVSDTAAIFPLYLEINYGGKDNLCDDGFERFGILEASFSGKYLNKGTVVEITFDEYYKDDFNVKGTSRITNLGLNSNGYMTYLWEVEGGRITSTNTDYTWEGVHRKYWVAGRSNNSQGEVDDDVFLIKGIATGRNTRGNTFVNEITEAYTSDLSCQWFTSGRSGISVPNLEYRTLNYGESADCDNKLIERRNNTYFHLEIPY